MRYSYYVGDEVGGIYCRTLKAAIKKFDKLGSNNKTLERHTLLSDAFERAYNGNGGFVTDVLIIKQRKG